MRPAALLALAFAALTANAAAAGGPRREDDDSRRARDRGIAWLLRQQDADGGWHSATYGQMRGGAGATAIATHTLAGAWPALSPAERDQVRRGLRFLTSNLHAAGFVQAPDGSSDYPTYATALAIAAIDRAGADELAAEQQRMRRYLAAVQRTGGLSTPEDAPDRGGWGLTGGDPADPGASARVGLSTTRFALEALEGTGDLRGEAAASARAYVEGLQCLDRAADDHGGFRFASAPDDPLNKAGWSRDGLGRPVARCYAAATADGLLGLLACGSAPRDDRVLAAIAWLERHPASPAPSEAAADDPAPRVTDGLLFYRCAALARAARRSGSEQLARQARSSVRGLLALQRADGSWANSSSLMKEDDPILATSFAIEALSALPRGDLESHPGRAEGNSAPSDAP